MEIYYTAPTYVTEQLCDTLEHEVEYICLYLYGHSPSTLKINSLSVLLSMYHNYTKCWDIWVKHCNERHCGQVVRAARLWCKKSL